METLDSLLGVDCVFRVRDAVHTCTRFLPQMLESLVQRLRREKVSDRKKLLFPISLGQFGYSVELR